MDQKIRQVQKRVLALFSEQAKDFALAGGTALELYYLRHRFSADLDFFSVRYNTAEIDRLMLALQKRFARKIKLESEFTPAGRARLRFYTMPVRGATRPLKMDFVEDVLLKKPVIRKVGGVRVYSAKDIYLQKIATISGTQPVIDEAGRQIMEGRREARDAFDLYVLSEKIQPLRLFLHHIPAPWQKGMVHWYRTFSRQELKLGLMDMDIYDKQFKGGAMIQHLENEIKAFTQSLIEAE